MPSWLRAVRGRGVLDDVMTLCSVRPSLSHMGQTQHIKSSGARTFPAQLTFPEHLSFTFQVRARFSRIQRQSVVSTPHQVRCLVRNKTAVVEVRATVGGARTAVQRVPFRCLQPPCLAEEGGIRRGARRRTWSAYACTIVGCRMCCMGDGQTGLYRASALNHSRPASEPLAAIAHRHACSILLVGNRRPAPPARLSADLSAGGPLPTSRPYGLVRGGTWQLEQAEVGEAREGSLALGRRCRLAGSGSRMRERGCSRPERGASKGTRRSRRAARPPGMIADLSSVASFPCVRMFHAIRPSRASRSAVGVGSACCTPHVSACVDS